MNSEKIRVRVVRDGRPTELDYPDGVESGILPVCDVLNSIPGVRTLWSCEGHPRRAESVPYVIFLASENLALRIDQTLEAKRRDGSLEYCWSLDACFGQSGKLQWKIYSNDFRIRKRAWPFPTWRRQMDAELCRLATVLAAVARLQNDSPRTSLPSITTAESRLPA